MTAVEQEEPLPDAEGVSGTSQITKWERYGRRMFRVLRWAWAEGDGHLIEIRYMQHSGEYVYGDLRVYDHDRWKEAQRHKAKPTPIFARPRVNFTSSRTISDLGKSMNALTGDVSWPFFFEELCILLLDEFEQGGVVSTIDDGDGVPEHASPATWSYLFRVPSQGGFVPDGLTSCILAHGGQGKTLMADLMTVAMITGQNVGPFSPRKTAPVLIVDWENNEQFHRMRIKRICEGLGLRIPQGMLHHFRPLNVPLTKCVDNIVEMVMTEGVGWCWLDSIGYAAGGDLNASEVATAATTALKEIPCATTFLAHTPKASRTSYRGQAVQEASPIGNSFWWNGPAAVYEIKASEQLSTDGGALYMIRNPKANVGRQWQRPVGYKVWFNDPDDDGLPPGPITCTPEQITGTSPGGESLPLHQRITDFLKRRGRTTPAEIAVGLGLTTKGQRDQVLQQCEQLAARGFFIKWGTGEHAEFAVAERDDDRAPGKVKGTPQTALPTPEADVPVCFCGQVLAAYLPDGTAVCAEHMEKAAG